MSAALSGFLLAIRNHDIRDTARLSTFSSYHVTGAIRQFILDFNAPYRVATTSDERRAIGQLSRIRVAFRAAQGRDMQVTEHDARIGVRYGGVNRNGEKIPVKSLLNVMQALASQHAVPIDDIQIVDPDPLSSGETALRFCELRELLNNQFSGLSERVSARNLDIFLHIAVDPEESRRRTNMAQKYNITPERVGQIYRHALEDIRINLGGLGIHQVSDIL